MSEFFDLGGIFGKYLFGALLLFAGIRAGIKYYQKKKKEKKS